VARFGITSVVSIVDDILIERMRSHYANLYGRPYVPILASEEDHRARRITAYLDLLNGIVRDQVARLRSSAFEQGSEIVKYFEMLADRSPLKQLYRRFLATVDPDDRARLESRLRAEIIAGKIEVNIMTKIDRVTRPPGGGEPPPDSSDAVAAFRGYIRSGLDSSVVLSAGINPRLFSYMERCPELQPAADGSVTKSVILKVSDYRSASIQGRMLAKKAIWVSEYRVESGLNCGGHAFATDGILLGPILQEFKEKRETLIRELHEVYCDALRRKELPVPESIRPVRLTVQGGIGTTEEDDFLREYFTFDGTGWGSPFLLVPDATNLDESTRETLAAAGEGDYYISDASPLGVSFNNVHGTSSETQILHRADAGRPGSPCTKKFLVSNTEFTDDPICTASRQYQALKVAQLEGTDLSAEERDQRIRKVAEKACLCEDLACTTIVGDGPALPEGKKPAAVAVCPGPNLAYFSKVVSLEDMVSHIYGRLQLIASPDRPHMFVNELRLYVDHLKKEIERRIGTLSATDLKFLTVFRANLRDGIAFYHALAPRLDKFSEEFRESFRAQLDHLEAELMSLAIPVSLAVTA
jgi:hypothetical protein